MARKSKSLVPATFEGGIEPFKSLEDWNPIDNPTEYVEASTGRWLAAAEGLFNHATKLGYYDLGANILFNLIKCGKLGRARATIEVEQRGTELDLSKLSSADLEKILAAKQGGE